MSLKNFHLPNKKKETLAIVETHMAQTVHQQIVLLFVRGIHLKFVALEIHILFIQHHVKVKIINKNKKDLILFFIFKFN